MGILDRIGKIAEGGWDVVENTALFVVDLATAPFTEDEYEGVMGTVVGVSVDRLGGALGGLFGPDTGLGAAIGALPESARRPVRVVADPLLGAVDLTYDYAIDRPFSTAYTMLSFATDGRGLWGDYGALFDLDKWRRTWNASESRSAGQAAALLLFQIDIGDPEEVDQFLSSPTGVAVSGLYDATSNIVLDPLNLVAAPLAAARRGSLVARAGENALEMPLIRRSSRSDIAPRFSLLPGDGRMISHIRQGFKISPELRPEELIQRRIDRAAVSSGRNTLEELTKFTLNPLDEIGVKVADDLSGPVVPGTNRSFQEVSARADAIYDAFGGRRFGGRRGFSREQSFWIASQPTAEGVEFLWRLYHGDTRVANQAVEFSNATFAGMPSATVEVGQQGTELQRLIAIREKGVRDINEKEAWVADLETDIRKYADETNDEAQTRRIQEQQIYANQIAFEKEQLAKVDQQIEALIADHAARQRLVIERGDVQPAASLQSNVALLAAVWDFQGSLRRGAHGVGASLKHGGSRFDDLNEERILNYIPETDLYVVQKFTPQIEAERGLGVTPDTDLYRRMPIPGLDEKQTVEIQEQLDEVIRLGQTGKYRAEPDPDTGQIFKPVDEPVAQTERVVVGPGNPLHDQLSRTYSDARNKGGQAWLDMAAGEWALSFGENLRLAVEVETGGTYKLSDGSLTTSAFDKFVTESHVARLAREEVPFVSSTLKLGSTVANMFTMRLPQGLINHADREAGAREFERMLRDVSRNGLGHGLPRRKTRLKPGAERTTVIQPLIDEAEVDRLLSLYSIADETGRRGLFSNTVVALADKLFDRLEEAHGKRLEELFPSDEISLRQFFDKDKARAAFRAEIQRALNGFDDARASTRGHFNDKRTMWTWKNADGTTQGVSWPITPRMMETSSIIPRFDLLARELDRKLSGLTAPRQVGGEAGPIQQLRQEGQRQRTAALSAYNRGTDFVSEITTAIRTVWKPSVLLRPAYATRVLLDEKLRSIMALGALATFGGMRQGFRDLQMANMRRRLKGVDPIAQAQETLLRNPEIVELMQTQKFNFAEQQSFGFYKFLEEHRPGMYMDEVSRQISGGTRAVNRLLYPAAITTLTGPAGLIAYMGAFGWNRAGGRLLGAGYSRVGGRKASRLANAEMAAAFSDQLLQEANNLLAQSAAFRSLAPLREMAEEIEADPSLARTIRRDLSEEDQAAVDALQRAADQLKTRAARLEEVQEKFRSEFGPLTPEERRALTATDRASLMLHNAGHGHIDIGGVAFASALGDSQDAREINRRQISAKNGATEILVGGTDELSVLLDEYGREARGILGGDGAKLWDRIVNREFRGFGTQEGYVADFTNALWLAPTASDIRNPNRARQLLDEVADRLGVESRADELPDIVDFEAVDEQFVATIADFLRETPEGNRLLSDMPDMITNEVEWVRSLVASTDKLLPRIDAAAPVRRRLADGKTVSYNRDVRPLIPDNPNSEGYAAFREMITDPKELAGLSKSGTAKFVDQILEQGGMTRGQKVRGLVNNLFDTFATAPVDTLSRNPFFRARYEAEVARRTAALPRDAEGTITITANEIYRIEAAARKTALGDLKEVLFDLAERTRFGEIAANVMPFYDAWQEVISRWIGLAVENPVQVARMYRYWSMDQNFYVEDEDGNKYMAFRFGGGSGGEDDEFRGLELPAIPFNGGFLGQMGDTPFRIRKDSINTIAQGQPGFGPILTVPVAELVKKQPELEDAVSFLYPFGLPQGSGAESFFAGFAPTTAKRLWSVATQDDSYQSMYQSIMRDELQRLELLGLSDVIKTDPVARNQFFEDVEAKADKLMILRAFAAATMPAQPFPTSPYQPMIDDYRRMFLEDPQSANDRFLETHGDEYFWLTMRFTKNNTGIPATQEGYEAFQSEGLRDLIEAYPDYGRVIAGELGSTATKFSEAVYRFQQNTDTAPGSGVRMRTRLSRQETFENAIVSRGWREYGKLNDDIQILLDEAGLSSVRDKGAEYLQEFRQQAVAQLELANPEWRDARAESQGNSVQHFDALRAISQADVLRERDDIVALREYLQVRRDMQLLLLARDEAGGSASLIASDNADLAQWWEAFKADFYQRQLAASSLFERYLESDLLDVDTWDPDLKIRQREVVG